MSGGGWRVRVGGVVAVGFAVVAGGCGLGARGKDAGERYRVTVHFVREDGHGPGGSAADVVEVRVLLDGRKVVDMPVMAGNLGGGSCVFAPAAGRHVLAVEVGKARKEVALELAAERFVNVYFQRAGEGADGGYSVEIRQSDGVIPTF